MKPLEEFEHQKRATLQNQGADAALRDMTRTWFNRSCEHKYSYHFTWLGVPIIQYPQDIVALQEIVWRVKPELIIETGIAHGGSLVLSASLLEMLGGEGRVVGVDVDIRAHNREVIEAHPMMKRITLIEGSSLAPETVARVAELAKGKSPVLVILDSNHTHAHVLEELRLYSPLVTQGSYLIVFDTVIEDMPESAFPDRPWGRGNNPRTALRKFLETDKRFVRDEEMAQKLLISVAPDGYLKCVGS
jgi:cephalosporin hydroxylase